MEDGRIIELLSEMLIEMRESNQRLGRLEGGLEGLTGRVGKLEEQQAKTNVTLADVRLAVTKLATSIENAVEHEKRIARLEAAVFK